jgi:uncharacterized protein
MAMLRILNSLDDVPSRAWDALHDGANPFIAHAFLAGLEQHGCLRPDWGWQPHHLTLWQDGQLVGAVPGYRKTNSHGEFVFDHAWAQAYARYGQDYFPKWLGAVPYSPVTGPRLLAQDAATRQALLEAVTLQVAEQGWSSAHLNFHTEEDDASFPESWLQRLDVQYHWRNPGHWHDFAGFLDDFDHKHRKNIRQERAKLAKTGVRFRTVHGDEASRKDLQAMFGFYLQTFNEYGNSPALTFDFIEHLAREMPRNLVVVLAELEGDAIAGALCLRGTDTLYGRYWGATRTLPGLHFETCYYQGIEYCLREGLRRFEPGAQGEHKIARGFLPELVRSRHWIADPDFSEALARWCGEEREAILRYARGLQAHSPFKTAPAR